MHTYLPLRPPAYEDIEKDYRASLIYTLSWAWIIAMTILKAVEIIALPQYWMRGVFVIIAVDILGIICLVLNVKKYMRLACILFPIVLWMIMTVLALTAGGIYAPAIVAYLPIIITAGFLLGRTQAIIMAVVCILSALTFVILDIHGDMPERWFVHTSVTTWICYSLSCLQITILVYWAVGRTRASFQMIAKETEDLKQTEMRLRESEFNNRMVVENKILGVAWVSSEGRILNQNTTMSNMLGYQPGELKGTHFGDLTHPDDLERELKLIEKIKNKEIDSYTIEKRIRCKNGEYLWVELNRTAYYNGGSNDINFYIVIIQNIQERKMAENALKESEERYRVLVQNAVEAVIVMDVDKGKFVAFSDSALQVFGLTAKQLLEKGPVSLSPEYQPNGRLSSEMAMEKINEAVTGGKPVFEWTHRDADGNPILAEVRLVRLPATDRVLVRGSIIDISDRKKAEEDLKISNERLRQLSSHLQTIREEERTTIAREIHDELGQQLTGLKMDASWLAKKIPTDDKAAQEKMADMFSLIDGTIKTVRKISSDLRPGLLEDLGLEDALEWQCVEFEKRTGITCRFHAELKDHYLDKKVATGIFRVFQEAVTNITRHSKATQVHTTLEITDDQLALTINDNGVGFDPKKPLNKETFGLMGMEERALMLKGKLKIESEEGKGTTIILQIPLTSPTEKTGA